jgi:hypothetical protein
VVLAGSPSVAVSLAALKCAQGLEEQCRADLAAAKKGREGFDAHVEESRIASDERSSAADDKQVGAADTALTEKISKNLHADLKEKLEAAVEALAELETVYLSMVSDPMRNDINAFENSSRSDVLALKKFQANGKCTRLSLYGEGNECGKTLYMHNGVGEVLYDGLTATDVVAKSLMNLPKSHPDKVEGFDGPLLKYVLCNSYDSHSLLLLACLHVLGCLKCICCYYL